MSHRNNQFAQVLLKGLSKIIREEISQEKYGLITVTDCVVTPGLDEAKVYISALHKNGQVTQELNRKKKNIINQLKQEINLRKIPRIDFITDTRPDMVEHLDAVFEKIDTNK